MSNWATPQARDERNPDQTGSGNFQRKVERGFTIDLNSQAAMWTTPNVPNGGRSLPADVVESRGQTGKGKRQVGLHNEAELWRPK